MNKWKFYTSKEIKPQGWLKRQLEIQAETLGGNLDKIWKDIRESSWIGGTADGWERVPYWLDGFIPLAYLLDNDDFKARAQKYIDAIISNQKESGWICPCEDGKADYDTWAVELISKVLTVYYDCTGDERIPDVIYRVMKNYYEHLKAGRIKLFRWAKFRWFEAFIAIRFLKERYDDEWITDLARIIKEQGADYESFADRWETTLNTWTFETHIVNLAMMLKYEAVSYDILGDEYRDLAEKLRTQLDNYNGTPVGLFTGDENLAGLSPIHGTELCAVVEQMYSYELLYAITGEDKWAERLEVLAFNALPGTFTDDMWAHQYDQLSNQISCEFFPGKPIFTTNNWDAHVFGLDPNYGCCTANFHQGWPKLALSTFMHNGKEIVSAVPIPSSLNDNGIKIDLASDYPFRNVLTYNVETDKAFTLKIRIPSFASNIKVNGVANEKTDYVVIKFKKGDKQSVSVTFDTKPELVERPYDLKTVKMGSLVFSIPRNYSVRTKEVPERENIFPHCYYELVGEGEWEYAYTDDTFVPTFHGISDVPFSSKTPAITLSAKVKRIDWGMERGYAALAAEQPRSRKTFGEEKTIELYPYGSAKLRMTEIPLIKKGWNE